MKRASFYSRFLTLADAESPFPGFKEYCDLLTFDEWLGFMEALCMPDNEKARRVVQPAVGFTVQEYFARLMREVSARARQLSERALDCTVKAELSKSGNESDKNVLMAALSLATLLEGALSTVTLETILGLEGLQAELRVRAAYLMSDATPARLLSIEAPWVSASFLVAPRIDACRGVNVKSLPEVLASAERLSGTTEALDYPLRIAMANYAEAYGIGRTRALINSLDQESWLAGKVQKVLRSSVELRLLLEADEGQAVIPGQDGKRSGETRDSRQAKNLMLQISGDVLEAHKNLRIKTLRASQEIWQRDPPEDFVSYLQNFSLDGLAERLNFPGTQGLGA